MLVIWELTQKNYLIINYKTINVYTSVNNNTFFVHLHYLNKIIILPTKYN